jgi:hypothetical protein
MPVGQAAPSISPVLKHPWRAGIKENDGRGEFNYDVLLRTFVSVTMYSQNNNNI